MGAVEFKMWLRRHKRHAEQLEKIEEIVVTRLSTPPGKRGSRYPSASTTTASGKAKTKPG